MIQRRDCFQLSDLGSLPSYRFEVGQGQLQRLLASQRELPAAPHRAQPMEEAHGLGTRRSLRCPLAAGLAGRSSPLLRGTSRCRPGRRAAAEEEGVRGVF